MEYTFTRKHKMTNDSKGSECTRAWDGINAKLARTLESIVEKKHTEAALAAYIKKVIHDGSPLPKNHDMIFWEYDAPDTMPGDARCDFVYLPTYLMVLSMAAAVNQYPGLMGISGIRDTLSRGLKACTGRGLAGAGFDSMSILLKNVQLFTRAGIKQFLAEHPETCPGFAEMFQKIIADIRSAYHQGRHIFDFEQDFREEQRETLAMYDAA